MRILIVDDDTTFSQTLAEILEIMGHTSKRVFSAQVAVAEMASYKPHAVITDYWLSRNDKNNSGIIVLKEAAKLNIPFKIIMSSYPDDSVYEIAEADFVIDKRCAYDQLQEILKPRPKR